jgi:type VI secretion system protein ImpH
METESRRDTSGLIADLVKDGPSYNVWQAIWLGENITSKFHPERKDYLLEQKGLNFRPDDRYEYPPKDIKSVSFENGYMTFVLTFMGLYGINSPLPRCYHEQVAFQQRILGIGDVPLQNFFDIFNNRFYWLYYNAWKKYRYQLYLNKISSGNKITERLGAFTGKELFNRVEDSGLNDFILLKFSGIFSSKVRNKASLKILLTFLYPDYQLNIREFVPKWIELSEIPALGDEDSRLGKKHLRRKIYSRQNEPDLY